MSSTIARPTPTSAAAIVEHEERERLAGDRVAVRREGDEVHVDRREHELDAHQHEHAVATGDDAVDTGREEEGTEQEELIEEHDQSFRARTTAPMSAASSNTPTTSNGTR